MYAVMFTICYWGSLFESLSQCFCCFHLGEKVKGKILELVNF